MEQPAYAEIAWLQASYLLVLCKKSAFISFSSEVHLLTIDFKGTVHCNYVLSRIFPFHHTLASLINIGFDTLAEVSIPTNFKISLK